MKLMKQDKKLFLFDNHNGVCVNNSIIIKKNNAVCQLQNCSQHCCVIFIRLQISMFSMNEAFNNIQSINITQILLYFVKRHLFFIIIYAITRL